MQTPVFLDHLPDVSDVSGGKTERYRHLRNNALLELLLDSSTQWHDRDCPACGSPVAQSQTFGQAFIPFQRCAACNTIYAARVPAQQRLDALRLQLPQAQPGTTPAGDEAEDHSFEFISTLNWVSLTAGHLGRGIDRVLDYRFTTHAPRWEDVVAKLSHNRRWQHLPLAAETGEGFDDLAEAVDTFRPDAILIQAEMDRVASPDRLLDRIRQAARPGTLVFIASSCADGLEYELLGSASPSFIPLDRLTVFSIAGLETLARRLGYEVLEKSTPGRRDAIILRQYFLQANNDNVPFWSGFFRDADKDRLTDLQILLQRSLRSSLLRFVIQT
ncbi:hypothetical protein ACRARG_16455 [Pseudooceanicola sp. C21-150M6]|uniref:hypothetical protein n=1 Tax=Pseudooceanicola sp. C21-150M6 TaxID=3434355 RepID=UPI003D7F4799